MATELVKLGDSLSLHSSIDMLELLYFFMVRWLSCCCCCCCCCCYYGCSVV